MAIPDFSKDSYYGKIYSRAHNVLLLALIVTGGCAAALPLFVGNITGLVFTYLGYVLVAGFGYKLGVKPALLSSTAIGLADVVLLWPYVKDETSLEISIFTTVLALVALSLGFGSVGRVARDFSQIKFSDQLPKAVDRDVLMMVLDKELARAKRHRQPSSLAIIELKILDKVEKAHGNHQMELLLRQLQLVLVRQLRKSDTLAWLGGPYFALLMSATDRAGAEITLNRLRESARHIPTRSYLGLGMDVADWRIALTELKSDDGDPQTALTRIASNLGPLVPQRIGLA